jgi:membrane protein YdbS with pleckstrin-like domain
MTDDAHHSEHDEMPAAGTASVTGAAGITSDPVVDIADGSVRMLSPAYIRAEMIAWWITTAVVFGCGVIALAVVPLAVEIDAWIVLSAAGGLVAITAALVLGALRWPAASYKHSRYVVSPLGLEIRRGVVWRSIINVPRSRVQHTDVMQGPIQRKFDLATLTVHTAGTEHATVAMQGLSHEMALRLRDFLIRSRAAPPGGLDDAV